MTSYVKIYCAEGDPRERGILKEDLTEDMVFTKEEEISNIILDCDILPISEQ